MTIVEETAVHIDAIRDLLRRAFGGGEEADLVDRLRADGDVILSLVATEADCVVGVVVFSTLPIERDGELVRGASLAPVAVAPERQGGGVGSAMIRRGLEMCRDRGVEAVVVLGWLGYYPRFGFSADLARGLRAPFSGDSFMAVELRPGALAGGGTVRYARAFRLV
jgi:putative acetyltransferase